jgi:hypothetical protein
MRIANAILAITAFFPLGALGGAQEAPATRPAAVTVPGTVPTTTNAGPIAPVAAPVPLPSSLLQPSLDVVRQTLSSVRVERWKRGSVRDEANTDINSINVDLQQRVPALLKDADSAPGTLSKTLPVSRHVDALYDVLLRIVEASRMAAPDDQANQLRSALENLERARLALDDSMETIAGSQEKQLADLRVTVQKQAAFKCPAPPPVPVCPKVEPKKPLRRRPKPTTGTSESGNGTTQKAPATGASTQNPGAGNSTQPKTPAGATPANSNQQKPTAAKPKTAPTGTQSQKSAPQVPQ